MSQKFTIIGTKSILFAMNYSFHSVTQMKYNYIIPTGTMQVSASIGYDKALIGAKSGDFAIPVLDNVHALPKPDADLCCPNL